MDRQHAHFTNLDFVTGRLLVHLTSETSIDGIQVKLEGESKTRLAGPRHGSVDRNDRRRTELEVHKVSLTNRTTRLCQLDENAEFTMAN